MTFIALLLSALLLGPAAPVIEPASVVGEAHNFHVSYGQMAVEGNRAFVRIRFFRDDLEAALRAYAKDSQHALAPDAATDSLFTRYLNEHFVLAADGATVPGVVVSSGEENGGPQPMWWYEVQFEAPVPLRSFSLRNTLLFDTFGNQKNLLKVRHYPEEQEKSFYFVAGAESYTVSF